MSTLYYLRYFYSVIYYQISKCSFRVSKKYINIELFAVINFVLQHRRASRQVSNMVEHVARTMRDWVNPAVRSETINLFPERPFKYNTHQVDK